jgi:hypothetical protein
MSQIFWPVFRRPRPNSDPLPSAVNAGWRLVADPERRFEIMRLLARAISGRLRRRRTLAQLLAWRFRTPHYLGCESNMRSSEPKPRSINELPVSRDSEVRKRGAPQNDAKFGIGTLARNRLSPPRTDGLSPPKRNRLAPPR